MRTSSLFTILMVLVALGASAAYADTTEMGGSLTGIKVQDTFILEQNDLPLADELDFTAWQKECWVDINGWDIDIQTFNNSSSARTTQPGGSCSGDQHAVALNANNPPEDILLGGSVRVDVDLWLTKWNSVRIADVVWSYDGNSVPAVPGFGWIIEDAVDIGGGLYQHTVRIINDGATEIWLTAIWLLQTAEDYGDDLVGMPPWFADGTGAANVQVGPGQGVSFVVTTSGSAGIGEFIYLRFQIRVGGEFNPVELVNFAKHEIGAIAGPDSDQDEVPDDSDNCIEVMNPNQLDADADGIGNICDADLSQDCQVNPIDLGLFKLVFFTSDPIADFDGNGIVNVIDLGIFKSLFFLPPGPSGVPNICDGS